MSRRNQLRYLYESSRLGTMRAASEKLEVEPSTISRQIARLEDTLGIELIERSRRKIQLTEAGRLSVDYFREIRTAEETYLSNIEDLKSVKSGQVVVSLGDAMINESFQAMLDHFLDENPNLKVTFRVGGASQIISSVLEDESHFGAIFHVTTEPRISIRLSLPQPLQAIVSPAHSFAQRKSVTLDDLSQEPLALPPESFQLRRIVQQAEREQEVFLDCALESESFALLAWFARSGHGVTILNDALLENELRSGKLIAVPIESSVLGSSRISLISRAGRKLPLVAQRLLIHMERYFKQSFDLD
ncbi:LysR family transcriptional regulator [Wenzhouxiangellaceae bacterium CH-27]|uniref:LysR family transcriptional regulator n=1 Tax=Elongatibacter sediminis TaxID=3119006 RepID=A0AAW9RK27_9GAMM